MYHNSEFGLQGGSAAWQWPTRATALAFAPAPAKGWRGRISDWADDIDLVPDLGRNIGSLQWFRGLLTCTALCAGALSLSPGFAPLPAIPERLLSDSQFQEMRSQSITPLALGADSGRRMGPSNAVVPLKETPERPQIELNVGIGNGDSFGRALQRAGVSAGDADTVMALVGSDIRPGSLKPGTRMDIVLGRRATRDVPRPLESLTVRARLDLSIQIARVGDTLDIKRIPIKVDATPLRVRGTVNGSLYQSARGAGAPPKAIQSFLRVIAQQMSIESIRAGDQFDIITAYRRAETGEAEVGDLLYAGMKRSSGKTLDMLKWASNGRTEWFEASGVGERRGVLARPVAGRESSSYGMRRHPILGYTRMHAGIDFAAAYGSPIYAATDGVVEFAGRHGGHGKYVKLKHGNGLATGYAHMSQIAAVVGQRVRRGQVIGYVGSTGLSTGPHLHYELYRNGQNINPTSVKFTTTAQLVGKELAAFKARLAQLKSLGSGQASAEAAKDK